MFYYSSTDNLLFIGKIYSLGKLHMNYKYVDFMYFSNKIKVVKLITKHFFMYFYFYF